MRIEYEIVQQLMWDNKFRRSFLKDRKRALVEYYPDYQDTGLFSAKRASVGGLEEEAFRRMAGVCRSSKEIFPRAHSLLISFYGNEFFEEILRECMAPDNQADSMLEIFDGYIVGPLVLSVASAWPEMPLRWIERVLTYEWAIWQARRVANGWPPLLPSTFLSPGATLVSADFDLPNLIREIARLDSASVCPDVYRWRIVPSPGSYYAAILPKDGEVIQVKLVRQQFDWLREAESNNVCDLSEEIIEAAQKIGLLSGTSSLCCPSNEYPK